MRRLAGSPKALRARGDPARHRRGPCRGLAHRREPREPRIRPRAPARHDRQARAESRPAERVEPAPRRPHRREPAARLGARSRGIDEERVPRRARADRLAPRGAVRGRQGGGRRGVLDDERHGPRARRAPPVAAHRRSHPRPRARRATRPAIGEHERRSPGCRPARGLPRGALDARRPHRVAHARLRMDLPPRQARRRRVRRRRRARAHEPRIPGGPHLRERQPLPGDEALRRAPRRERAAIPPRTRSST